MDATLNTVTRGANYFLNPGYKCPEIRPEISEIRPEISVLPEIPVILEIRSEIF